MSLAPSEQQELTAIEGRLCRSDPALASMFAVFTGQINLRQGPVREAVSAWRPGAKHVVLLIVLAVLAVMLIADVTLGIVH